MDHNSSDRGLGFSDLLHTASSFMSSSNDGPTHHQTTTTTTTAPPGTSPAQHGKQPSYQEVISSAQVVFQSAKTKLHSSPDDAQAEKFDAGKLAGATANLFGAAVHYGKLDENKYGNYAHKAEEYLRGYEQKHGAGGTGHSGSQGGSHPVHGPQKEHVSRE